MEHAAWVGWGRHIMQDYCVLCFVLVIVLQCPVHLSPEKKVGYFPRTPGYIPKILIVLFPCGIPVEARSSPEAKIIN